MARAAYDPLDPYAQDDTGEDPYATTNDDARQSLLDSMAGDVDTRIGITDPGQGPQKAAEAPAVEPQAATASGPSYDDVNRGYQQYLGRSASQDEYGNWMNGTYGATDLQGILGQIQGSGEAQAYRGAQGGGQAAAPTDLRSRIDAALQAAESTDDPSYWYGKIGGDPNGGGSAWNYWLDRINRGNGSKYIRNGSLSLFNDTPGATPNAGNNWSAAPQSGQAGPAIGSGSGALSNNVAYHNPMIPYITQLLQSLLGRDQQPIGMDSPEVNPALTAYKGNRANALAEQRNALAERAAGPGGAGASSGAFEAASNAAQEKAGQDTATFGGNLIYNANQQRQQQLQSLLALATSLGLGDQAQQIQDEMNRLNLGYNYTALDANLNQNALLAGLRG